MKTVLTLPFSLLEEGQRWEIGRKYRVEVVLRQTHKSPDDASFMVLSAKSLERADKGKHAYVSSDGVLKG